MKTILLIKADAELSPLKAEMTRLGLSGSNLSANGSQRAIVLGTISNQVSRDTLAKLPGVSDVLQSSSAHPRLDLQRGQSVVVKPRLRIGPGSPTVLAAGPCAAESRQQVLAAAEMASKSGAKLLRGGAFKPRTSPYSFSGHGQKALEWLAEAAQAWDLALVTEVMSEKHVSMVAEMANLLQIGSRNMQNFALLHAVGQRGKPVLLKRGRAASLKEWRLAAEHLLNAGASGVIFCERGILGSDPETRNTLDLAGAALLKHVDNLAVMVDPSHSTGRKDLIIPMCRAALAVGVDGLLVECHPDSGEALSDGSQALNSRDMEAVKKAMHWAKSIPIPGESHTGEAV